MRITTRHSSMPSLILSAITVLMIGCSGNYRDAWESGNYEETKNLINERLVEDLVDKDAPLTTQNINWVELYDANLGLERAYVDMVLGHGRDATLWLSRTAGVIDGRLDESLGIQDDVTTIADERISRYSGLYHEHVISRALLALIDAASGGGDSFAYAAQVGSIEKQLSNLHLNPVADQAEDCYRVNAFAHYAAGVIQEAYGSSESTISYKQAYSALGEPDHAVFDGLLNAEDDFDPNTGVLFVFDFRGIAPRIVEGQADATASSLNLVVSAGVALVTDSFSPLAQSRLPVREIRPRDPSQPVAEAMNPVKLNGADTNGLEILNTYDELSHYLAGARTHEIARGIIRRVIKAGLVGELTDKSLTNKVLGSIGLYAESMREGVDDRSWSLLPESVVVSRHRVPVGDHAVSLTYVNQETGLHDVRAKASVIRGGVSVVIVFRPTESRAPAVYSQVIE